ncbi:MAG: putative bifunctional diguanylate cyclase/phosphodiesterase [Pseudomonadota bacterium]
MTAPMPRYAPSAAALLAGAAARHVHQLLRTRLGALPATLLELAALGLLLALPLGLLKDWLDAPVDPLWTVQLHTVAEVGATAATLMVFFLTWNTRHWGQPTNLVVAGAGFLGVSVLNVLHLMVFPGMPGRGLITTGQSWLAAVWGGQALTALALCAAGLLPADFHHRHRWFQVAMATAALWVAAIALQVAGPPEWQLSVWSSDGIATARERGHELLAAAFVLAAALLARRARGRNLHSYGMLATGAMVMFAAQIAFARDQAPSDRMLLVGHLYKVASLWLIYHALFREGVHQPYRGLAQSQRDAAQSHAHYQQLFESSPDGLLVVDRGGVIRHANAQAGAMFGWPLPELLGQTVEVLVPDAVRGRHVGLRQGFAAAPHRRDMAEGQWLKARRRDGSTFPIEVALVPQQAPHIDTTLCIVRDVSRRRALEERLLLQATHDELTGLANRRHFTERMAQMLAHARRQQQDLAVMFIDLDHFKKTNDTLGHEMGDQLLCEIAARLRSALRESDLLARMGGDEFAVVLADLAHSGDAAVVARKLLELLLKPVCIDGHEMLVGASIGITMFPGDGQTAEALLRHADLAMYRAKASGRNTWCFYQPEMNERMRERVELERALHHALERGELEVYYQPRVSLQGGAITGCEALLRWHHPQRGDIRPDVFIPIAEETGVIVPIGEWVLRQACDQARAWAAAGLPRLQVAVNVSARQLSDAAFPRRVRQALEDMGWTAGQLELEITETALMSDTVLSTGLLGELKSLGVRTAVDDFGTGYSSLAYLKSFPLHRLKVDRSFVAGVQDEGDDRVIATTIIVLAHSLGLQVTAEGVETAEQAAYLLQQGCDEAQGYHFGRPVPAAEFERMLRERSR